MLGNSMSSLNDFFESHSTTPFDFMNFLEGAARTRAPTATNSDVYASRRKILQSPGPKCNGAGSSRPSALWIMDTPRPGK
jgi:hypothetical protein